MKTVSFTEFRKNASNYFSAVEAGEVLVVIRHGKAIAEIKPTTEGRKMPAWKKPGLRLSVKG
ncbi:MAG: type II toxin-antitoxin system Phd/YefM family antitoxin, partial [Syntrophales bacterium]|nr:type II toxin-antitoxin system Phd/YefM family antitoxin [Syntrophales bacterium]